MAQNTPEGYSICLPSMQMLFLLCSAAVMPNADLHEQGHQQAQRPATFVHALMRYSHTWVMQVLHARMRTAA